MNELNNLLELLNNDKEYSREDVIEMIATRLEQINELNPTDMFNLFYKLDISEYKLNQALMSSSPYDVMAKLVIERQLQKIESKRKYSTNDWIETE